MSELTEEQIIDARTKRQAGRSILSISNELSITYHHAVRILDPDLYERRMKMRNERKKQIRMQNKASGYSPVIRYIPDPELVKLLLAEIPTIETRDTTGVLMGDPIKGRSALDKRVHSAP